MSCVIDLGVTTPSFMRGGNHDIIGFDGIYYFAIGARPFEWMSLRFSKHHICTHSGDEYPSGNENSVTGGYIFLQNINKRRLRIGFNCYNGRALSNKFYNRKEKFIAFNVAMDI